MKIKVKRVYEEPGPEDGMRILVDRLWPRGIAKEDAQIDLWSRLQMIFENGISTTQKNGLNSKGDILPN